VSTGYRIAYRLGFTPWERAGRHGKSQLDGLLDEVEQGAPPYGRALDVGCGRGEHSLTMAGRGWDVTGIDAVPRALAAARSRADAAGTPVRFLEADVTNMRAVVGEDYRLLLDVGCFHGLNPDQRGAYAREATSVAAPGATLLLMAFGPGGRGPVPRGATRDEIARTFRDWSLLADGAAETAGMPGPLKKLAPRWYSLRRS